MDTLRPFGKCAEHLWYFSRPEVTLKTIETRFFDAGKKYNRLYLGSYYCDHYFTQTRIEEYMDILRFQGITTCEQRWLFHPCFRQTMMQYAVWLWNCWIPRKALWMRLQWMTGEWHPWFLNWPASSWMQADFCRKTIEIPDTPIFWCRLC